jgi:hypothetical protein
MNERVALRIEGDANTTNTEHRAHVRWSRIHA